ncbi:unnamed protein product [Gongylonema pulchrum]|uniref:NUC153 domain-containing protein n=1 Tax=Gongylonema pulchrum TaxID=637853 RepID=A0A183E5A7_9BILA|nr:unnamed protein product [Gongylonema pulchrum]
MEILAEKSEAVEDFAGEFETYAPKECDEFDTYVPSSPKKRKKVKRLGKRPNGWKQSVSHLFGEENGPETQNGYEEYSACENAAEKETDCFDDDDEKSGFTGPGRSADDSSGLLVRDVEPCETASFNSMRFRAEVANIPLGKAKKLREKVGIKLFDKAFFDADSTDDDDGTKRKQIPKRDNPKRPREASSKVPVSKFRNAFGQQKLQEKK